MQEQFKLEDELCSPDQSRLSRADFLKIAAVSGSVVAVAGVLTKGLPTAASASGRSPAQDADILNFLLLLEYIQAAFYREAVDKGALNGDLAHFARVAADHEDAHVNYIRSQVGSKARHRPGFDFGDATSSAQKFARVAVKLEELNVSAYVGQGANLTREAVLRVGRIASVEGRHAAWVRDIDHQLPAPAPADAAVAQKQVAAQIRDLGFITGGG